MTRSPTTLGLARSRRSGPSHFRCLRRPQSLCPDAPNHPAPLPGAPPPTPPAPVPWRDADPLWDAWPLVFLDPSWWVEADQPWGGSWTATP